MTLPKMKPCNKCGEEPMWCTGWDGDNHVVEVAVWLHCKCRAVKRSITLAEAMDESKTYDIVQDIAHEWRVKE